LPREPKTQSEKYLHSDIMTSGKSKSVMLLVKKAGLLVAGIDPENLDACRKEIRECKNIIAQLEMSLNLKNSNTAQHIFEMYELIYTALETPTSKSLEVARFLLQDYSETLKMKFGN